MNFRDMQKRNDMIDPIIHFKNTVFRKVRWTKDEIAILQTHYKTTITKEMCYLLPGRSEDSISMMAGRLGLTDNKKQKHLLKVWISEEDIELVRKFYPKTNTKKLVKILGGRYTQEQIYMKAGHLGIHKSSIYIERKNVSRAHLIVQFLYRLRLINGLSKEKLSEKLGYGTNVLDRYERGQTTPRLHVVQDFLDGILGYGKAELVVVWKDSRKEITIEELEEKEDE
jgi:hypothetical protein